jgi:hypothetical protein
MLCRRLRRLQPRPALLLSGALLLLTPLAAAAQEPAGALPDSPAVFLIETITVEGARSDTAAHIVEAESLLDEGATYTEADLRQAVARIHRLPFLVDATFSLRKGSTRGAYELVIQVDQTRWFFYDFELQESWNEASIQGRHRRSEDGLISQTGLVGARAFLGRSGVLYGSYGYRGEDDDSGVQIGYTRYDLFGRGVIANISFSIAEFLCCDDDELFGVQTSTQREGGSQLRLNLAVPISLFQAIQVDWTEGRQEAEVFRANGVVRTDLGGRRIEARWVRDTSDDPLLPREGSVLSAGVEYRDLESFFFDSPQSSLTLFHTEVGTAVLSATRHWPLTPRQSVSAGGLFSFQRVEAREQQLLLPQRDITSGSVSARHLFRIWTLREPGHFGDLYLESGATYGIDHSSFSPGADFLLTESQRLELSTALIYRNQWGRLRFTLSYFGTDAR